MPHTLLKKKFIITVLVLPLKKVYICVLVYPFLLPPIVPRGSCRGTRDLLCNLFFGCNTVAIISLLGSKKFDAISLCRSICG